MDKNTKARIKQLKKEKKYDEIFYEFGKDAYKKYVRYSYRFDDLYELLKEGKYEDIYNKHGEEEYNRFLIDAKFNEIKEANGIFKAYAWYIRESVGKFLKKLGINTALLITASSATFSTFAKYSIEENRVQYRDEIEAYNDKIEDYAQEVNALRLNNTQIFMKVMDDMWGSIKGYAEPKKDIIGFQELDLATEEGYGVCRNMASDVAKKLNEINPEYNARTMSVLLGDSGYYEIADIEQKIFEPNETVEIGENNDETTSDPEIDQQQESDPEIGQQQESDPEIDQQQESDPELESDKEEPKPIEIPPEITKKVSQMVGNHVVTFVDIPGEDLTIVLDPTNPGIGIYVNGKIIMLNSAKENGIQFDAKEYVQAVFRDGEITEGILNYIKSFRKPKLTMEEIEEKYGVEAQNKALYEVRALKITDKALEEQNEEKQFKEEYKVDLSSMDISEVQGYGVGDLEKNIEEER